MTRLYYLIFFLLNEGFWLFSILTGKHIQYLQKKIQLQNRFTSDLFLRTQDQALRPPKSLESSIHPKIKIIFTTNFEKKISSQLGTTSETISMRYSTLFATPM